MASVRRTLATAAVVAAAALALAGCTTGAESEPEDSLDGATAATSDADGTSPIVFAFVCSDGSEAGRTTYTTAAAAWQDRRTHCTAERITGSVPSTQQRSAVEAAHGAATLEELAATCAERGTGPWTDAVRSTDEASLAAGLTAYCPGHPEIDHLRDAISSWRG